MAFDFKKEYREFYLPKDRPEIVAVPAMHYMAVRGQGDPNQPEGLCVQCMHLGPFDTEAETVARMDSFLAEKGYVNDLSETRMHHEIYLSDARRVIPEKWKTVIRHPIRRG